MTDYLQAIATILSLVNPAICAAMFLQAEAGRPKRLQVTDATKSAAAVLVILSVAALAGTRLLHVFGVSLDAFQVAGGGVLVWMGFLMLRGPKFQTAAVEDNTQPNQKAALAPLILFAASPGVITGVITLSVAHTPWNLPVTSLVASAVAVAVMWMVLLLTVWFPRRQKRDSLVHDVSTRFMGLIVVAMGVQFALTGVRAFFTNT
jgi:multiple antibiotic resistance protein